MTVIAWDGVTLAADKQATTGYIKSKVTKVYRTKWFDGRDCLIGMTGDLAFCHAVKMALTEGEPKPKAADFDADKKAPCGVLITRDGTPHTITPQLALIPFDECYYALGSGAEVAWGAMEAGAPAKLAVQIAIKRSDGCGFEVDEIQFEPAETRDTTCAPVLP